METKQISLLNSTPWKPRDFQSNPIHHSLKKGISDCNWTRVQNHLVRKRTLVWPNGWVFVYELSACFGQGVPWHSDNYKVWNHSETRTWHDKNIQPKKGKFETKNVKRLKQSDLLGSLNLKRIIRKMSPTVHFQPNLYFL